MQGVPEVKSLTGSSTCSVMRLLAGLRLLDEDWFTISQYCSVRVLLEVITIIHLHEFANDSDVVCCNKISNYRSGFGADTPFLLARPARWAL